MTRPPAGGAGSGRRFERAREVLWRYTADGVVLLPLQTSDPFVLEGAGAALWQVLREPHTLATAAEVLSDQFDVPLDEVLATMPRVMNELVERGAVTASGRDR